MTGRRYTAYAVPSNNGGWTDWITPVATGYRLQCCDCGLVHEVEFRVNDDGDVQFRVRRDNRASSQVRRHRRSITLATGDPQLTEALDTVFRTK